MKQPTDLDELLSRMRGCIAYAHDATLLDELHALALEVAANAPDSLVLSAAYALRARIRNLQSENRSTLSPAAVREMLLAGMNQLEAAAKNNN